jgi:PTS system N-acetylgalactosamine-specific IIA component
MIGFIVTGHGYFSKGVVGALELIAGEQESFKTVNFLEEKPLDDFQKEIRQAISDLKGEDLDVVVFADLLGGTPFNTSILAAQDFEGVEVIAGVNLPMLLESTMLRYSAEDLDEFVKSAVEAGQAGVAHPELDKTKEAEASETEEGI